MSLGLVVLEKKFVTRTRTQTRTPQSDAIMSADIKKSKTDPGLILTQENLPLA